jgi:hypothetical protein
MGHIMIVVFLLFSMCLRYPRDVMVLWRAREEGYMLCNSGEMRLKAHRLGIDVCP